MRYTAFAKLLLAAHKAFRRGWLLQFMIERLLESNAPAEAEEDEEQEENGDEMKLTSIQSITIL